ncbi:hypothetical protein ACFL30_03380, partial [Candidatus Latescibacterota bacterium]
NKKNIKQTKPLTKHQAEVVKKYNSGKYKTLADIGMSIKPYKTRDSARASVCEILQNPNVQARHPEILNRNELDEDCIAQELKALIHASKTVFFSNKGEVTDERQVPDNTVRMQAVRTAAEVHGMIGVGSHNTNIKNINYLDMRKCDDADLDKIIAEGEAVAAEYEVVDNSAHDSEHTGNT